MKSVMNRTKHSEPGAPFCLGFIPTTAGYFAFIARSCGLREVVVPGFWAPEE
jgi:hypothetical protein